MRNHLWFFYNLIYALMTVQKIKMSETFKGKEHDEMKEFLAGETYEITDESLAEVVLQGKLGTLVKDGKQKTDSTGTKKEKVTVEGLLD